MRRIVRDEKAIARVQRKRDRTVEKYSEAIRVATRIGSPDMDLTDFLMEYGALPEHARPTLLNAACPRATGEERQIWRERQRTWLDDVRASVEDSDLANMVEKGIKANDAALDTDFSGMAVKAVEGAWDAARKAPRLVDLRRKGNYTSDRRALVCKVMG